MAALRQEARPTMIPSMTLTKPRRATLVNAGRRLAAATAARDAAVIAAHEAGATLREIGEAIGLSHAGVRRVIDRRPPGGSDE